MTGDQLQTGGLLASCSWLDQRKENSLNPSHDPPDEKTLTGAAIDVFRTSYHLLQTTFGYWILYSKGLLLV
jgi:hypothetical protein